jgi:hypothetical protein
MDRNTLSILLPWVVPNIIHDGNIKDYLMLRFKPVCKAWKEILHKQPVKYMITMKVWNQLNKNMFYIPKDKLQLASIQEYNQWPMVVRYSRLYILGEIDVENIKNKVNQRYDASFWKKLWANHLNEHSNIKHGSIPTIILDAVSYTDGVLVISPTLEAVNNSPPNINNQICRYRARYIQINL